MEGKGGRRRWRAGLPPFVARRAWMSGGRFAARAAGLAAAEVIPGSAAPPIKARHCRAKISGAAEPCHVSGQRFRSPPHQPSAAPPCMARHRHLAASGQ